MGRGRKIRKDAAATPSSGAGPEGGRPGRPVLRAVLSFVGLMAVYYILEYVLLVADDKKLLRPYLGFIASSTADILGWLGQEAAAHGSRVGARIGDRSFNVEIVHGCDAMEPMAAFLAAVLASPVAFRSRLVGLAVGLPALFVVNYVRLVTLFLIGVYASTNLFDIAHHEVWQAAFIAIAIVFWAIWVQWATRTKPEPEGGDDPG